MKVIFLGTNGWYDTETGSTVSVLIESREHYIIIDAGFGFYKAKDYIKPDRPVSLFLSHMHLDHIIGLHTLPIFKISQGIDIYIPRPMERYLRSFLKRPYTTPPLLLPTKIRFHDALSHGRKPFNFQALLMRHAVPCYGYRFTLDGFAITYCTDTGICNNLKRIAKGADLLMTECAMAPGDKELNLFHITPETAARVAAEAGAKKLALFHFDPGKYPSFAEREEAERVARSIFPATIAARDGTVFTL